MAGNRPATGLNVFTVQEATNKASQRKAIRITPSVPAATDYASGDVLFQSVEIPNAVLEPGGTSVLEYFTLIDYDDSSGSDMDFIFYSAAKDLGTVNAAVDWTKDDMIAAKILGIAGADISDKQHDFISAFIYQGPGVGSGMATSPPFYLQAEEGSTSVYMAGVARASYNTAADPFEIVLGVKY
jgi:hypothetical protein